MSAEAANNIVALIQDAQLEYSLKLSETKKIKLGKNEYTKKPLTGKSVRELYVLNDALIKAETDLDKFDALYNLRTKGAELLFGITKETFDENYEKLGPIIQGHLLRINTELSPDIDFNKIRDKANSISSNSSSQLSNTKP